MIGLYDLPDVAWPLYCGPAAIAAFTDKHPNQEIRAAINEVRGNAPSQTVKGMTDEEIVAVLRMLGMDCGPILQGRFETLRDFLADHPGFTGVVGVSQHFIAVSCGWCLDNGSRYARPVGLFRGNRKVVRSYIPVLFGNEQELSEYD